MDLKELKDILRLLEEEGVTEFELEEEGMRIRIKRGAPPAPAAPTPPPGPSPAASVAYAAPPAPAPVAAEADPSLQIVRSPIVGTFYRSPDPNSPAFVNVGDRIKVGQVLCIIEAMKLMNEIEAEVAGEVVRIEHESGQPVQYGEALFAIRTDR